MRCIFCGRQTGQDDMGDRRVVTCCELARALASDEEVVTISHDDLVRISGWLHNLEIEIESLQQRA